MTASGRFHQDVVIAPRPWTRQRVARLVTELLAPAPTVAALLVVVAWHSAPSAARVAQWGLLALGLGPLLPLLHVLHEVRHGRVTDRHVRRREQRPRVLLVGLTSVLVLLDLLAAASTPRELVALVGALVVGLVASALVTLVWKVSLHAAAVAGTVVILALLFGPALLVLAPAVALVGWARVEVGDHTPAQAALGAGLAAAGAGIVFTLLRQLE